MRDLPRRYRAVLVYFVALTLPLFSLYFHGKVHEPATPVEVLLVEVTSPVQTVANAGAAALASVWSDYVYLISVHEENERLLEENRVLLGEALRAKKLKLENQRIKALLGFKERMADLRTIPARVVAKDVSPYYRVVKVVLDAGSEDAVREGMPVMTHEGVVGRITRVTARYSEVMLAVDTRSHINVTIGGKGVTGVLQGAGESNDFGARFRFLHKSEPIEVNDTVVTSGHDKVFPPGLEVGYVASADVRQDGLYYEYDVTAAVNFSTLEEVLVIAGREREPIPEELQEAPR